MTPSKTIFDAAVREELISRIQLLNETHTAEWGKMKVLEMLLHNNYWNTWVLGLEKQIYKQAFIGKLFGKISMKRMINNEKPFDKNIPTSNQFKVAVNQESLATEKQKWIQLIINYSDFNNSAFIHDFFGKMTPTEIGILVYKHTDHHLRQFGV